MTNLGAVRENRLLSHCTFALIDFNKMSLENRFEILEGVQQVRRRIIFATAVFQQPELLCQVPKTAKGLAYGNNAVKPLFRIHDISVWIRMGIRILLCSSYFYDANKKLISF